MLYIDGQWRAAEGAELVSENPATGETIWSGRQATPTDVAAAIGSARRALPAWSELTWERRAEYVQRFGEQLQHEAEHLAGVISQEVGKPRWEALGEVRSMIDKIPTSIEAMRQRRSQQVLELPPGRGVTRYKPHGVVGVFGPFNFPGHIANGQIVPALLAGNSVVFKPSELTPMTAEETVKLWELAGLPAGVLNLVQGAADTGAALVEHRGHDGILFTGSLGVGMKLREALLRRPEAMLALELGGNNALVVQETSEIEAAVYWTIQSAYATGGQRCTCARRLIVPAGNEAYLDRLQAAVPSIGVGRPADRPEPFMGPLIHAKAAAAVLAEQQRLIEHGACSVVECRRLELGPAFVTPGLIDVTDCRLREDQEVFGPLLQVIRVANLQEAIEQAAATQFGLVAAIFSDSRDQFDAFYRGVRAGLINWNRPTTGASGQLPFGGLGRSGNHRPAGFFAIDFCNAPVASLEAERLVLPEVLSPGVQLP